MAWEITENTSTKQQMTNMLFPASVTAATKPCKYPIRGSSRSPPADGVSPFPQNARASMRAALASNIVNAVLDALFVQVGLGIFGLGLATTLARLLNLCLLLRLYCKGVGPLKLDRSEWRPDPPLQ